MVIRDNSERRKTARPDSWKTKPMPLEVAYLSFNKTYTEEEFGIIASGYVPQEMEDKWFIFMQNKELFFHRSWTGFCIYKVVFEHNNYAYIVREALVNKNIEQYKSIDSNYETSLLGWLIDNLLLRRTTPFPIPNNLAKDAPSGLFQHHISRTGFPEVQIKTNGNE